MYQAGVMFLSEYLMDAMVNGREGGRIGNPTSLQVAAGSIPGVGRR